MKQYVLCNPIDDKSQSALLIQNKSIQRLNDKQCSLISYIVLLSTYTTITRFPPLLLFYPDPQPPQNEFIKIQNKNVKVLLICPPVLFFIISNRRGILTIFYTVLNQLMNKSKQIQEEYSNLKIKVQGRIKELESKLGPHPSPNKNRSPLLQHQNTHNHHHHCHHPCRGNYCNSQLLSPVQLSLSHIEPVASEMQSMKHINVKNNSVNSLISEALVESLKNQKQINEHIKAINEKIQNLSVQHNRSNLSEVFSESMRKPQKKALIKGQYILSEEKMRCHSELKRQEQIDPNKTQAKRYQVHPTKVKSKLKSSNTSSSKLFEASSRKPQQKSKSKSNKKLVSEYFLSFGCPLHSPNKISLKSIQKKEVYKDAQHRNRKHQKNHLLQSFKQQERSRKRLLSKISQNAFSEYGSK